MRYWLLITTALLLTTCSPKSQVCKKEQTVSPQTCELQTIYFDFDSNDLTTSERDKLSENAACLEKIGHPQVVIGGHEDEKGTSEYNLALSSRRAEMVLHHLKNLGVPEESMKAVGYGESRPVCTESTEECWAKNRRVDFEVQTP